MVLEPATLPRIWEGVNDSRTEDLKKEIIETAFVLDLERLPSNAWILERIIIDQRWENWHFGSTVRTSTIRTEYTRYSFPILTDEFLSDVVQSCETLKPGKVVELSSGIGWLSWWLRKYGLEIDETIDDQSWVPYKDRFLPFVTKADSVEYAKKHHEVGMYILSWPYMDDVAERVWKTMVEGQYLLYIGESAGGCNATDEFFGAIGDAGVPGTDSIGMRFLSFWGIHDWVKIYQKRK